MKENHSWIDKDTVGHASPWRQDSQGRIDFERAWTRPADAEEKLFAPARLPTTVTVHAHAPAMKRVSIPLATALLILCAHHVTREGPAGLETQHTSKTGEIAAPAASAAEKATSPTPDDWVAVQQQIAFAQSAFQQTSHGWESWSATGGERMRIKPGGTTVMEVQGDRTTGPAAEDSAALSPEAVLAASSRPDVSLTVHADSLGRERPAPVVWPHEFQVSDRHQLESQGVAADGTPLTAWWKSTPDGVQLGWTVPSRPPGDGPLRLGASVDAPWPGTVEGAARSLVFTQPGGEWTMRFSGLRAWDAGGHPLPARFDLAADRFTISVDDTLAKYPITIDPWLLADRSVVIRASDPATDARFGREFVACGSLLVVQARDPASSSESSAWAYIIDRIGSSSAMRRKITLLYNAGEGELDLTTAAISGDTVAIGSQLQPNGHRILICERNAGGVNAFGTVAEVPVNGSILSSVALSGDILAVGAFGTELNGSANAGNVRIHHRNAGGANVWGQVAEIDAGAGITPGGYFGLNLKLQDRTLAVVARGTGGTGHLHIYRRNDDAGTQWSVEKSQTLPSVLSFFQLALYGDTVAVGLPSQGTGEVRLYSRNAGGAQQWGLVRTLTGGTQGFGQALALNGSLLAVGAPREPVDHDDNAATPAISNAGAVRVYARNTGGVDAWGLVESIIPGTGAETGGRVGDGVAFADGRLLIGMPKGNLTLPAVTDAGTISSTVLFSGSYRGTTLPANAQNSSEWGAAVAMDGRTVVVGAPFYDTPAGADAGGAFVFRDGLLVAQLFPSNAEAGARFGHAVAIDGDRIAVGSPYRSGVMNSLTYADLGNVYIFERNQGGADAWDEVRRFGPANLSTSSSSPEFGRSLALRGDVLAIGAPQETFPSIPGASVKGRVKIHYRNQGGANQWGQVRSFQGDDRGSDEQFGHSLALDGDTLVVGSPREESGASTNVGAAFVFRRNINGADLWGRAAKLVPPAVESNLLFGFSVAISGDDIAVGAPITRRGADVEVGAVHLYAGGRSVQNSWQYTRTLQPDNVAAGGDFGYAVSLHDGQLLAGAPDFQDLSSGRYFLFGRHTDGPDQWGIITEESGGDPRFAMAVALHGNDFVIGEPRADVVVSSITQTDRGRAMLITMTGAEFRAETMREIPQAGALGGSAVAVHGDWMVVGAPGEDVGSDADAGAAYVFHRDRTGTDQWGLVQKLVDVQDAAAGTRFGAALALDSQWLFAGVPGGGRIQSYYRQDVLPTPAAPWVDSVSLTAGTGENQLGSSLALAGDLLLAGAPQQTVGAATTAGAAYLFQRNKDGANAWGLLKQLTASDAAAGDNLGASVSLTSEMAAAGAPRDTNGEGAAAGAVYLFSRNTGGADLWGQSLKLTDGLQTAGDEFGSAVALEDSFLLVGAPKGDVSGAVDAGEAYLYERNEDAADGWGRVQSFVAPDFTAQSRFGSAVAVDAAHAVISAPFADPRGLSNAGTVHVFSRNQSGANTWAHLQSIAPGSGGSGTQFGASVCLESGRLAIGAPGTPSGGEAHLYVFAGRLLYDDWAAGYGLEGARGLPAADADGDGQPNLVELILGSHPASASSTGRITIQAGPGDTVTLTAFKLPDCNIPVFLSADHSTDLQNWQAAGAADIVTDDSRMLSLQFPRSGFPRRFIRWRATLGSGL